MTDDEKFADLRKRSAEIYAKIANQFPVIWSDDKGERIHEVASDQKLVSRKELARSVRRWERDVCRVSFDSYARMLRRDYGNKAADRFIIKDLVRKWRMRDNVVQNGQRMIIDSLKWQSRNESAHNAR